MMEPPDLEERFAPSAAQVVSLCTGACHGAGGKGAEAPRPDLLVIAGGNQDAIPLLGQMPAGLAGSPALPLQGGAAARRGFPSQGGPMLGHGGSVEDGAGVDELGAPRAAVEALEGDRRDKDKKDKDNKQAKSARIIRRSGARDAIGQGQAQADRRARDRRFHAAAPEAAPATVSSGGGRSGRTSAYAQAHSPSSTMEEEYKNRAVFLAFARATRAR